MLSLCIVGSQQMLELGKSCAPIFPKNISFMSMRKAFVFLNCVHLKNCCSIFKNHPLSDKPSRQFSQINFGFRDHAFYWTVYFSGHDFNI